MNLGLLAPAHGQSTVWLDGEPSLLRNACDDLAALGLVSVAGFAVAVVGIRTAVEPVVVGAGPQRVVSLVAVEPVLAAHGSDGRVAVEVGVVAEHRVVAAATGDPVVAGFWDCCIGGAVAVEELERRVAADDAVVAGADCGPA